jgi:hypothetical protein
MERGARAGVSDVMDRVTYYMLTLYRSNFFACIPEGLASLGDLKTTYDFVRVAGEGAAGRAVLPAS